MFNHKHITISGDKHYINLVIENATTIDGIVNIVRSSDTAAKITYDPQQTNIGDINKALRRYRSERGASQ